MKLKNLVEIQGYGAGDRERDGWGEAGDFGKRKSKMRKDKKPSESPTKKFLSFDTIQSSYRDSKSISELKEYVRFLLSELRYHMPSNPDEE